MYSLQKTYVYYEKLFELIKNWEKIPIRCIDNFKKEFCNKYNFKEVIFLESGTIALYYALKFCELKTTDEVIFQTLNCDLIINTILLNNATPVPADINEKTFNLDLDSIKKVFTKNTKVIILSHIYGQPVEKLHDIIKFAKDNNLIIIEDCAHSIGAKVDNKFVGTFGDYAIFSCRYIKNFPVSYTGGILATVKYPAKIRKLFEQSEYVPINQEIVYMVSMMLQDYCVSNKIMKNPIGWRTIYEILSENLQIKKQIINNIFKEKISVKDYIKKSFNIIENYGINIFKPNIFYKIKKFFYYKLKTNFMEDKIAIKENKIKMNIVRAEYGRYVLKKIDDKIDLKNKKAHYLRKNIVDLSNFQLQSKAENTEPAYLYLTLITNIDKNKVVNTFKKSNIDIRNINWPNLLHFHKKIKKNNVKLINSEKIVSKILNFPLHDEITYEVINNMIDILTKLDKKY